MKILSLSAFYSRARGSDAIFPCYDYSIALNYCIIPLIQGISSFKSLVVEAYSANQSLYASFYLLNCVALRLAGHLGISKNDLGSHISCGW